MASGKDTVATASSEAEKIKINFASVEDLQKLPYVGKKTAEKKTQSMHFLLC